MGAALVMAVHTHWTFVSDPAFRVLSRMALTALDNASNGNEPGLYYAGRELLARSLKQPFPEGDDDEAERRRERLFWTVRKAVRELVAAGAIERVGDARPGRNQVYRLKVMGVLTAPPKGVLTAPPNPELGGAHSTAMGVLTAPPEEYGGTSTSRSDKRNMGPSIDESSDRARDAERGWPECGECRAPWPLGASVPADGLCAGCREKRSNGSGGVA